MHVQTLASGSRGNSTLVRAGETHVLLDAGLPLRQLEARFEDARVPLRRIDHIVLTHGHADHMGDTVAIAKANKATVYCAFEIYEYLTEQGVQASPGNPGGKIDTDFGFVAFTQAFHSSSFEGRYMGMPCGIVANIGGTTIYHCGDTALFGDMKLIGEIYKPDIACIPVGDRFTMGPELGAKAAELIQPKVAIPIHYKT